MSAPVKPIAPVVPVARVAPVPIVLEQVEPVVAPVVSPPQVVYNMANDPEIEVIMEVEAPAPVEPQPPVVDNPENGPELEIVLEIPPAKQRHTNPYYKSKQRARHQRREKK